MEKKDGTEQAAGEKREDCTEQAFLVLSELPNVIVSSGQNLDYALEDCLARIGTLFSASRVYVMLDEKDGRYLRATYEWVNRESGSGTFAGPLYDYEHDVPSLKPILDEHTAFFATLADVPHDIEKIMVKLDIGAIVITPIFRDGQKIGLAGIAFHEAEYTFCNEHAILVNALAGLVSLVLDRKQYYAMRSQLGAIKNCVDQLGPFIDAADGDEDGTAVRQRKATTLIDAERNLILETLEIYNGNKLKAAKHLGLTWPSLDRRCKKLGIEVRRR